MNRTLIPEVIPLRIRTMLRDQVCGVCSISYLEAAILHRLHRLELGGLWRTFSPWRKGKALCQWILTPQIARLTNELPQDFQGDPFDRTIAATARALKPILITADRKIRDADFCEVEYYPFKPARS